MQRRAFELQLPVAETAEDELLTEDLGERLAEIARSDAVDRRRARPPGLRTRYAERLAAADPDSRARDDRRLTRMLPSMERPAEFDRLTLEFLADPR